MPEYSQGKVVRTRSSGLPKTGRGKSSGRTKEQQDAHEATYKKVYMQRQRDLVKAAKDKFAAHRERVDAPILPYGGGAAHGLMYTSYQVLAFEFILEMQSLVPAEVLAKGPVSINKSCVQRFAARLTKPTGKAPSEQAVFKSVEDVRLPGEPAISDFVLISDQIRHGEGDTRAEIERLVAFHKAQLRISSPFCVALKLLPSSASLLEHYRVVSIASRPRMGATTKAKGGEGGGLQYAQNYEGGAHTAQYVSKHVAFDNRRFGVAATRTQEDVHQAMGLTTTGFASISSLRGHQQKRKLVHVASRRAASMWMFQVDAITNAKFAAAVVECMPFSDEGTREGVGCCVAGMLCLVSGHVGSRADFLGIENIPNKEGRSIGGGMLRISKGREVAYVWYFWLSDSYAGIVGHRSGAIAHMRVELERPLVFPIKCAMHIVSRCWKAAVNDLSEDGAGGGCRNREPIKRKANDAQVSTAVLLLEDTTYLYRKDRTLRTLTISLQLGHFMIAAGCIDTRFEHTIESARNTIGVTILGDQVREIFQHASGRAAAPGVAQGVEPRRVTVSKLRGVLEAGPNEIGSEADEPAKHRFRAGSRAVWDMANWEFPSSTTMTLKSFSDCYHGKLILPQLGAIADYLNPEGLSRAKLKELQKSGGGLPRPATCKVTSLTPEKNLGFVLDVGSRRLIVMTAMNEVFGLRFVRPFLHFVELRMDGVVFRMHTELEKHLAIVEALRTPEDDQRSTDEVLAIIAAHSASLAFDLRLTMRLAASLFSGNDWYGWVAIGKVAKAYGDYAESQFEDWQRNPAFMLARVFSEVGGPEMARELSSLAEGKGGKLHVRLAEFLHTTPQRIETWLGDDAYDGPLRILTDPMLKKQLKEFGEQTKPLSRCLHWDALRQRLLRHYSLLRAANSMGEEWVKYYKALLPQQIGKGMAWCEVKLRSIIRARIVAEAGDVFAPITMEELKSQRKASGDSNRRRFKLPPGPPLVLPPEIPCDGAESEESGCEEEEEEGEEMEEEEEEEEEDMEEAGDGEEEGEEDLWALGYREVQRRLRQRSLPATGPMDVLVPRLQLALLDEAEGDGDDEEGEEEEESEEEGDEGEGLRFADPNDLIFRSQIRRVPSGPERAQILYLDAALWCFDEDADAAKRGERGEESPNGTFFAINLMEHYRPGTTYIAADTLMYIEEAELYVVDQDFAGSTRVEDRRAHMNLLFTVETQALVEVEEGYKGERAWRIERRSTSAASVARSRIDAAAGESDESGDERDGMEEF